MTNPAPDVPDVVALAFIRKYNHDWTESERGDRLDIERQKRAIAAIGGEHGPVVHDGPTLQSGTGTRREYDVGGMRALLTETT